MVEEGKRHQCTYDTGCGTIILGVSGSRIAPTWTSRAARWNFTTRWM